MIYYYFLFFVLPKLGLFQKRLKLNFLHFINFFTLSGYFVYFSVAVVMFSVKATLRVLSLKTLSFPLFTHVCCIHSNTFTLQASKCCEYRKKTGNLLLGFIESKYDFAV